MLAKHRNHLFACLLFQVELLLVWYRRLWQAPTALKHFMDARSVSDIAEGPCFFKSFEVTANGRRASEGVYLESQLFEDFQNWNDGNGFSGWVQQIRDTTNFPKNGWSVRRSVGTHRFLWDTSDYEWKEHPNSVEQPPQNPGTIPPKKTGASDDGHINLMKSSEVMFFKAWECRLEDDTSGNDGPFNSIDNQAFARDIFFFF